MAQYTANNINEDEYVTIALMYGYMETMNWNYYDINQLESSLALAKCKMKNIISDGCVITGVFDFLVNDNLCFFVDDMPSIHEREVLQMIDSGRVNWRNYNDVIQFPEHRNTHTFRYIDEFEYKGLIPFELFRRNLDTYMRHSFQFRELDVSRELEVLRRLASKDTPYYKSPIKTVKQKFAYLCVMYKCLDVLNLLPSKLIDPDERDYIISRAFSYNTNHTNIDFKYMDLF